MMGAMRAGEKFADLSSNNGDPSHDDLKVYAESSDFLVLKVSEQSPNGTYVWPQYAATSQRARSVGLVVGGYHFARPGISGTGAAQTFLAHLASGDGAILDMEGGGWAPGEAQAVVQSFCTTVERARPALPIKWVYATASFVQEHGLHLPPGWGWWQAAYPRDYQPDTNEQPAPPPGWPHPVAWQFTDHGALPGLPSTEDVSIVQGPGPTPAPPSPHPAHLNPWDPHRLVRLHGEPGGNPVFLLSLDGQGLNRAHIPMPGALQRWQDYLAANGYDNRVQDVPHSQRPTLAAIRPVPYTEPPA